jgi:hypothetical protein
MASDDAKGSGSSVGTAWWRRGTRWIAVGLGAGLLAAVTAFGTGLGSKAVDSLDSSVAPPLSYSTEELVSECGSAIFLPEDLSKQTLKENPPYSLSEWAEFQHQPGAILAGGDVVEVSVQGESKRKVTLTGIRFDVEHLKPKKGATFAASCGDGTFGRAMIVDLDENPPQVVASSKEVGANVGVDEQGHSLSRRIRFPWTVSVVDPLLLYLVMTAESCFCRWRAEIPWVSGSKRGVIEVDNGGSGYKVFADSSFENFVTTGSSWRPL